MGFCTRWINDLYILLNNYEYKFLRNSKGSLVHLVVTCREVAEFQSGGWPSHPPSQASFAQATPIGPTTLNAAHVSSVSQTCNTNFYTLLPISCSHSDLSHRRKTMTSPSPVVAPLSSAAMSRNRGKRIGGLRRAPRPFAAYDR